MLKISAKLKLGHPQWRLQMQVGYVKCSRGIAENPALAGDSCSTGQV